MDFMSYPVKYQERILRNLRKIYTHGTRIELCEDMVDIICGKQNPHAPKKGDRGTVTHVDDAANIHVKWDKGGSLALVYRVDNFIKVNDRQEV